MFPLQVSKRKGCTITGFKLLSPPEEKQCLREAFAKVHTWADGLPGEVKGKMAESFLNYPLTKW